MKSMNPQSIKQSMTPSLPFAILPVILITIGQKSCVKVQSVCHTYLWRFPVLSSKFWEFAYYNWHIWTESNHHSSCLKNNLILYQLYTLIMGPSILNYLFSSRYVNVLIFIYEGWSETFLNLYDAVSISQWLQLNTKNGQEFTWNDSEMTTGLKIIIGVSWPFFLCLINFKCCARFEQII